MPIYEYECSSCNKTFEVVQKINDKPLTKCNLCGKGKVKKLISSNSFILKGMCWANDNYAMTYAEADRMDREEQVAAKDEKERTKKYGPNPEWVKKGYNV